VHPPKKKEVKEREVYMGETHLNRFRRFPPPASVSLEASPVSRHTSSSPSAFFQCVSRGRFFVMMSASMSDVGRYVVLIAFLSQASRIKWNRTLMCLVRS